MTMRLWRHCFWSSGGMGKVCTRQEFGQHHRRRLHLRLRVHLRVEGASGGRECIWWQKSASTGFCGVVMLGAWWDCLVLIWDECDCRLQTGPLKLSLYGYCCIMPVDKAASLPSKHLSSQGLVRWRLATGNCINTLHLSFSSKFVVSLSATCIY